MKNGTWMLPVKWENFELTFGKYHAFKLGSRKGFVKIKDNNVMKAFEGTNEDGFLNKGDKIMAKGKIELAFWSDTPLHVAPDKLEIGRVKSYSPITLCMPPKCIPGHSSPNVESFMRFENHLGQLFADLKYVDYGYTYE